MLNTFSSIENDLIYLENNLAEFVATPNIPTNQILSHIFSTGGKRIRPALFFLFSNILNYNGEFKYPIAAVCEFIHTASLLHDDVIDNSTLRRNKSTVNSIWGDETAILSGDLIYSTACRMMIKTRHLELIDCFAECIRFMSESELFQLDMIGKIDITKEQYFKIVHGKTAFLFEASSKTPSYLCNQSSEITLLLAEFGKNLGFAFQIADDCLDYIGNAASLGKPVLHDLAEGKVTLPLIFALEKDHPKLKPLVQKFMDKEFISESDQILLVELVHTLGGLNDAIKAAEQFSLNARNILIDLQNILKKQNVLTNTQDFDALNALTLFALNRKS